MGMAPVPPRTLARPRSRPRNRGRQAAIEVRRHARLIRPTLRSQGGGRPGDGVPDSGPFGPARRPAVRALRFITQAPAGREASLDLRPHQAPDGPVAGPTTPQAEESSNGKPAALTRRLTPANGTESVANSNPKKWPPPDREIRRGLFVHRPTSPRSFAIVTCRIRPKSNGPTPVSRYPRRA